MNSNGALLPSATNDYLSIRKFEKYALGYNFEEISGYLTFAIYDNDTSDMRKAAGAANYYRLHSPFFRLFKISEDGISHSSFCEREQFIEFFFEKDISLGLWMLTNL
jgi:hypothetical protein